MNYDNILLDRLPVEYEGYLIRTSFRIGIQLSLLFTDPNYTDEERIPIALNLLYGNGIPEDLRKAVDGLTWFMAGGEKVSNASTNEKPVFYWDFDSARIYSSFMSSYGIDLTKEDMHWFKFIPMLGSIRKDSALSQAINIRTYDTKNLSGKAKAEMMKLRNSLTPKAEYSDEEKEKLAEFESLLNGGEK